MTNLTQYLAKTLDDAMLAGHAIERLTAKHPDLSIPQAYDVCDAGVQLRAARGETPIGLKMGFTSRAKREQMGLDSPIYGVLTDRMQLLDGSTFSLEGKIHPKIEPEIAFKIGQDLHHGCSYADVEAAISDVYAAMEILDSRYLNFKYFSLPDVVADNASSSYFVLSRQPQKLGSIDLAKVKIEMEINGTISQWALGEAISGHPLHSIMQLCELLHSRGKTLKAGTIVMAGAATQAVTLEAGMKVTTRIDRLGDVHLEAR